MELHVYPEHKPEEGVLKWFILLLLPLVNLYALWRLSKLSGAHRQVLGENGVILEHVAMEDSVFLFSLFVAGYAIALSGLLVQNVWVSLVGIGILLFPVWQLSVLISGHKEVYIQGEKGIERRLKHREVDDSVFFWFLVAWITPANLYFMYKLAKVLAGHGEVLREEK